MRSKTESRRCGCGAILSLRESCKACADAARARLHAGGVCMLEGLEQTRSQALVGSGGTFANPAAEPAKIDYARLREACARIYQQPIPRGMSAVRKAYEECFAPGWGERFKQAQANEPPPVGAEVSYAIALADMQKRPEARYVRFGGTHYRYTTRLEAGNGVESGMNASWWASTGQDEQHAQRRWTRLPDATTVPVVGVDWGRDGGAVITGVRHSDGTLEVTDSFQIPAIGEEVAWERAKRDMQARGEARYRSAVAKAVPGTWVVAGLVCRHYWDTSISQHTWRVERFMPGEHYTCYTHDTEEDRAERRWVRLA